ncbi:MAG: lysophospholipid acyltransferase family protein [Bacteroidales bacterium]|jgi:KDO2-lipid IV(A) lauroyltransferase|nr:lysophospholipid acyltransferase family protein [Bacteroidales bacterium]MDY6443836.1 lysophospholipid acyltransferase family protein [Bacteroidales bacterium]
MHKLGVFLLKVPLRLLGLLPLRVHYALGRFVAWLAEDVVRYRRDVVMHNLTKAFPEKNVWDLKPIRKAFYQHFGELVAEAVWFGGCRNAKRLRRARLVEVENPEVAARLFEAAPSMVVMYSHCGNWELYGGIESYNYTDKPLPFNEQNFCVVYRELSSRAWDEVMRDNRFAPLKDRKHFPGYIETKDLIRYAYSHRDEKKIYNVNTDQRPYFESPANMDVDFFGQQVQTMTGAAALARKLGMSVAYLSMRRERRGHYVMRYEPICEDASKLGVAEIMQQYYRLVEADIRQQPENYLWTHQRFARM